MVISGGNPKTSERNLFLCHFVHLKSHLKSHIELIVTLCREKRMPSCSAITAISLLISAVAEKKASEAFVK
jgi:hypothetical protein